MTRRRILLAVLSVFLLAPVVGGQRAAEYDAIIRNGTVYDGSEIGRAHV